MRANDLQLNCSNYVYACLQGRRMPTRSYEHLVGAYGVVGFRGVKDAPKSVLIADASASAAWLQSGYKRETEGLHFDYKKAALGLHRGCTNAALVLHRGCRPGCGRLDAAAQD